jgi:hypothetical protein
MQLQALYFDREKCVVFDAWQNKRMKNKKGARFL